MLFCPFPLSPKIMQLAFVAATLFYRLLNLTEGLLLLHAV